MYSHPIDMSIRQPTLQQVFNRKRCRPENSEHGEQQEAQLTCGNHEPKQAESFQPPAKKQILENSVKSRTVRKHSHSRAYTEKILKEYPDLKSEWVTEDKEKIQMFHCYSCRKAYGKVPSNKLWVFASGFPDGKKLESEELKAHFNEHKYHKQALKMNTGSQTLEEIESTPIMLSSTDKVQISLLLQDINFVVKKNRPISFVFDLMKHFDEKIILLKHQSPDSVICELKQDVQNTIAFFGALKSTYVTAENKFWSDLKIDVLEDENTLNFSMCLEGAE